MDGKSVKRLTWLGIVLLASGFVLFSANWLWYSTRTFAPLAIPIALTVGHTSAQFSINVRGEFLILLEVDKEVPKRLLVKTNEPGLMLSWALGSEGKIVEK